MPGLKIKKGDRVRVLQGKDRGKEGEVVTAIPGSGKVVVAGVNIVRKHQRAGQQRKDNNTQTTQGGIIDKDMPIDASSVAIICSNCGPTRVGTRVDGDNKVRVCKKCGGEL